MYLYVESHSFFHRLHPVSKLLLLILMILLPFFAVTLLKMSLLFATYLAMLFLAGGAKNLGKFWKMLLIFWMFTFAIWMAVPFIRNWPASPSNAAMLATRIDTFVLAGLLFVTTCRIEEFTYALTCLFIPYKGAFAISLGFRLVPLFYQNLQTIVAAQMSRGVDLKSGSWIDRASRYTPIIAVLLSFSIRNADLMAMSLEAKGFGFSPNRTSYLQPAVSWRDTFLILPVLAAVLLRA